MKRPNVIRRSGAKIMASLVVLLGSLSYIMVLAIITGSLGFIFAMGVTLLGAVAIAKFLGEAIALSYPLIFSLLIGFGVLRGILRYIEQYTNHYIAFRLLAVLRDKIFSALRTLFPSKIESKQKGSIIAMITSDIEILEVFYAHTISPIFIAIVVSISVILFVGFSSSWLLAVNALISYIVIGILLPLITSKKLKVSGVRYRQNFAAFNSFFLDSIKGIKDIVLNNGGPKREVEVNERSDMLLNETKKLKKDTTRAHATTELFVSIFIFITLVLGAILVIRGNLTIGRMIIGVAAIFGSFGPVIAISSLPSNLTQTFAAGDRVLDLLNEKPLITKIDNGSDFEFENVTVSNVSFAYAENEEILNDVSVHANKGEIVGIVGPSGCGKSTLLKLLLRFYKKDEGTILYNDIEIENINSDNLLDNVTMVSQDTYLFDDTILENLLIAKRDATLKEVEIACKKASIYDFIVSLPQGFNSRVGVFGDNISAGEKQRIGLARAFLRGSKLILLDEPTSNVDSINEGIILRALKKHKEDRGIILVSHRESTMAIADRVYRFNGEIVEEVEDK